MNNSRKAYIIREKNMRASGTALKHYKSFIGSLMKTTRDGIYPKGTFFLIKDVKRYKVFLLSSSSEWTDRQRQDTRVGYKFVIDILDTKGNKTLDRVNICNVNTCPTNILPYSKQVINLYQ